MVFRWVLLLLRYCRRRVDTFFVLFPTDQLTWNIVGNKLLYSSIHSLVIITFASVHPSYAAYLRLSLIGYNCCVESWSIDLSKPVYTGLSLALRHLYFSSSNDPGELII